MCTKMSKKIIFSIFLILILIGISCSAYAVDSFILGVPTGTKGELLKHKIAGEVELYEKNGKKLLDNSIVKTGNRLKYGEQEFFVIVGGDITGTGQATVTDLFKMKNHLIGKTSLETEGRLAADINRDNAVTRNRYAFIKKTNTKNIGTKRNKY